MKINNEAIKSDQTGITSALICTVHCMIVPALLLIKLHTKSIFQLPLPNWWDKLDYAFLLISFYAVYHSSKHCVYKKIKTSLWIFWTMFAIAIVFEQKLHWMAYVASAGLITTHYINLKGIKKPAGYLK
jgi:hypothetical protein